MEKTINKVELSGYAGLAPELKEFENGGIIARLSLATNESYKNKEGNWEVETTWHKIVFKNNAAKEVFQKVTKGTRVSVLGKLTNRSWVDQNGAKHTITEIIALDYGIENKEAQESETGIIESLENEEIPAQEQKDIKKKKLKKETTV